MIQEKILGELESVKLTLLSPKIAVIDAVMVYIRELIGELNEATSQIDSLKVELARSRGQVRFLKNKLVP